MERNRLGFNIRDFAAKGGVSRTTQSNYENDISRPDAAYLNRIATTGAEVFWIMRGLPEDDELREKQALPYTPVIRELIEDYMLCPPPVQDSVRAILKNSADAKREQVKQWKDAQKTVKEP